VQNGGNYAEPQAPPRVDPLADRGDFAHHFMAKDRGRLDHLGVIAALPNFQVGAISESEPHAKQDFVGGQRRNVDFFQAQVLAPVQHGGHHFGRHQRRANYRRGFFANGFRSFGRRGSHVWVIRILRD